MAYEQAKKRVFDIIGNDYEIMSVFSYNGEYLFTVTDNPDDEFDFRSLIIGENDSVPYFVEIYDGDQTANRILSKGVQIV